MKVAAGIFNVGYHYFWTNVMSGLELDISKNLQIHLLGCDKSKWRKSEHEQNNASKANRKRNEYTKYKQEVDKMLKDVAKTWSIVHR